jgi:hypothetical protein
MMADDRDPRLQTLFADATPEFEADAFTARVMEKTRFLKYRLPASVIGIALVLAICALLLAPPLQEFAILVALGLTTALIDLGDGWIAWLFSPINTVGSLLIISAKAIRVFSKKVLGAS